MNPVAERTSEQLPFSSAAGARVSATASERAPISVLIPTRNEEGNIEKCLARVVWADEIVVVDSASSDRTVELARAHGATVVPFAWDGTGPRKRNWALANHPWRNPW